MPTLLVADDSVPIQRQIEATLAGLSLDLQFANTVNEAFELALSKGPKLILVDLDLSGGGSKALIRRLDEARQLLPTFVLLNPLEDYDQSQARRDGATGICIKPFDPVALQELVARYCPEAWAEADGPQTKEIDELGVAAIHRIRHELRRAMPGLQTDGPDAPVAEGQAADIERVIHRVMVEFLQQDPMDKGLSKLLDGIIREELAKILPQIVRQEVRARIAAIEKKAGQS